MTTLNPTISSALARQVINYCMDRGLDASYASIVFQDDFDALQSPSYRVESTKLAQYYECAARALGDPLLGVKVGHTLLPNVLGLVGDAAFSAPSLGEAIRTTKRYMPLLTEAFEFDIVPQKESLFIYVRPVNEVCVSYHQVEGLITNFMKYLRMSVENTDDVEVGLKHSRLEFGKDYAFYLNADIKFGCSDYYIGLPASYIEQRLNSRDKSKHAKCLFEVDRLLNRLNVKASKTDMLKSYFKKHSDSVSFDVAVVASSLNVSVRKLQRDLKIEGTSFRQLVDEYKQEFAKHLLIERNLPVSAVAEKMGFCDSSAFYKTFRRWTGCTPQQYKNAKSDHGES